ncbi:MAG: leucine-rich repeat domain-containing protein [Oscillospiraceae bacterium]|nr:leucine-rich repeat domain-containing protein [Oscillospiraceae bacterium]
MKIKKMIAILLAVVLVLGLVGCSGGGDPASDFEYRAVSGGIEITKYVGTSVKVNIPAKIEGEPVVSIGWGAFENSGIMEVNIPNSVANIYGRAFWNNNGLTSITLPDSLTSIGNNAFAHCTGLTSITLPDSLTSIEKDALPIHEGLTITYKGVNYDVMVSVSPHGDHWMGLPQEFYDAVNGN